MRTLLAIVFLAISGESQGIIHWLENHLLACPFKKLTGLDCPGCGLQRAVMALLKGDLKASFSFYPAAIPILLLSVFALLHLKFDFKHGAFTIKVLYIFATVIIIINYIYKVYHQQLF